MPTYEYQCKSCSYEFEEFQSMKDEPLKKCPECGKNKLVRLIGTGAGIIFKGSGFYETDYKRSSASKSSAAGETKASDTKKESTGGSSSEKKTSD